MDYYLEAADAVLNALGSNEDGLTADVISKRHSENGPNELTKAKKKSLAQRFVEQLLNPMVLVLLAAAAVSIFVAVLGHEEGGNEFAEAAIILAVVILNSALGVFQESKAEKAIEALREMSAATARVKRDGVVAVVPARELVIGDIVHIEAGDAIPADMRLFETASLKVEEAALTGESVPADKQAEALTGGAAIPLGDRVNMAYMGTSASYGRGCGVVTAIGMATEMGKIAKTIEDAEDGETPLQKRLSQLSKTLSVIVLAICVIIFAVRLLGAGELNTAIALESFMLAVSLAVAAIPEGLAAVVTIVLSIGVTNMAKKNAIIRRLTAVETLGSAQIICSDKTGTLTQNKMTVVDTTGDKELLARAMALCCDSELAPDGEIIGDPTENALIAFALTQGLDKNILAEEAPREAEAPFDSIRKMMTTIHKTKDGVIQYTKGAPDEVLRVCSQALIDGQLYDMTPDILNKIIVKNADYADKALRVLACAYKNPDKIPEDNSPSALETGLTFIGLAAMTDPVRPEVKAAVEKCVSAGIKAVMITGDHKKTAAAIAKDLGIITSNEQAITGAKLEALTDAEFEKRIENTFVYARVQPEHKVRIVNMWRKKGFITAMTGDGVNDAPAIKSADIGVGMGITGTDVTKNVADMVLADDNFATIVAAVEEGRRIYDNIRKTIQFLLSSNLSEVISIFAAAIMGFTLFKPVHLLFINLITDSLPAVALGMEHAAPGIMKRPARGKNESIFSDGLGTGVIIHGLFVSVLTLAAYFTVLDMSGGARDYAMTSAFLTMSMCEIFHSFNMRSQKQSIFTIKKQNAILLGGAALSLVLTTLVIYVPFLANIFSLTPLTQTELIASLLFSVSIIPLVEITKLLFKFTSENPK